VNIAENAANTAVNVGVGAVEGGIKSAGKLAEGDLKGAVESATETYINTKMGIADGYMQVGLDVMESGLKNSGIADVSPDSLKMLGKASKLTGKAMIMASKVAPKKYRKKLKKRGKMLTKAGKKITKLAKVAKKVQKVIEMVKVPENAAQPQSYEYYYEYYEAKDDIPTPLPDVDEAREGFNAFDTNKDGYISVKEFTNMVESLGDDLVLDMFKSVDIDGRPTTANFAEYNAMMSEGQSSDIEVEGLEIESSMQIESTVPAGSTESSLYANYEFTLALEAAISSEFNGTVRPD
jgi:hypothetical protein